MSATKAPSIFSQDPPPYELPGKATYTLPPSPHDSLISCTTSSSLPSYHIPSPLTTRLPELTISSTTTPSSSSSLPRYREVYKLARLPFVGFQLLSSSGGGGGVRAQYRLEGSAFRKRRSERGGVFLQTPLGHLRAGGDDRPALKVKHDAIEDAATGATLARFFVYNTADSAVRALELAQGVAHDQRLRDLLVAVWVCAVWNSSLEMRILV